MITIRTICKSHVSLVDFAANESIDLTSLASGQRANKGRTKFQEIIYDLHSASKSSDSSEELVGTFMRFPTSPQVKALLQWSVQPVDPVGNRIPNLRLRCTPLITQEILVYSWSYE